MQELITLRHAQSIANRDNVLVGHTDTPLSDIGLRQRNILCDYLHSISLKVDAIFSSDLLRAVHTIEPYSDLVGIPIQTDSRLREMFFGNYENTSFDDIDMQAYYNDKYGFISPSGESYETMRPRVEDFLNMLQGEYSGKRVLVSTHACVLRLIDGILLKKDPDEIVELEIGNGSRSHYTFFEDQAYQSRFACEKHFKKAA